jgi:tRNA modification GTPase
VPKEKTILVWNKLDLPHDQLPDLGLSHVACISTIEKTGLEALQKQIGETVWTRKHKDEEELLLTSLRHKEALEEALQSLQFVDQGLEMQVSAEFVCSDMRKSLQALAQIIGTDVTEDIITAIFSTFCLGK